MQVFEKLTEIRTARHAHPAEGWLTWGLVPTMGALHDGHISLIQQARSENDRLAVSVFVNPRQFNQSGDLENYPRQLEKDLEILAVENVDLVWTPSVEEMYPADFQTTIHLDNVTRPLEGAARPGHFDGVATVVAKLFNAFEPTRAYFGQKDAQQVAVIRQMVRDLAFNLEVIACPTVREPDGLAMSSRNQLLSSEARQIAPVLYQSLQAAQQTWQQSPATDAETLRTMIENQIQGEPMTRIDYVSLAHPNTLEELSGTFEQALVSMAVFVDEIRLIDNIVLENLI